MSIYKNLFPKMQWDYHHQQQYVPLSPSRLERGRSLQGESCHQELFYAVHLRYLKEHDMLTVESGSIRVKVFHSHWIRYLDKHLVEHAIQPALNLGFIFRVQTVIHILP